MGEEPRFNVVATPFRTPALGTIVLVANSAVGSTAVGDDCNAFIADLISMDVVVKLTFVARHDDESVNYLRECSKVLGGPTTKNRDAVPAAGADLGADRRNL